MFSKINPDNHPNKVKSIVSINGSETDAVELLAAPGENSFYTIYDMLVTNGSENTGSWLEIRENHADGPIFWRGYASNNGGGFNQPLSLPIDQELLNAPLVLKASTPGVDICVCITAMIKITG